MNECFTDPIFRNFRVERKRKAVKAGVRQRKEKEVEGKVSYSVSCDLQIT